MASKCKVCYELAVYVVYMANQWIVECDHGVPMLGIKHVIRSLDSQVYIQDR